MGPTTISNFTGLTVVKEKKIPCFTSQDPKERRFYFQCDGITNTASKTPIYQPTGRKQMTEASSTNTTSKNWPFAVGQGATLIMTNGHTLFARLNFHTRYPTYLAC